MSVAHRHARSNVNFISTDVGPEKIMAVSNKNFNAVEESSVVRLYPFFENVLVEIGSTGC